MSEIVEIVRMGHAGEGATADGLYVPLTVPGDVVRVTRTGTHARIEEFVRPGPSRIDPVCAHFGVCGGCALQMMQHDLYLAWKRELVVTALKQRGFVDPAVEPIRAIPPGTRRRAVFKAKRLASGVALGFYQAASHRLVDVRECPVLVPELVALLEPLKHQLGQVLAPGEQAELHLTATDSGVDVSLNLKRRREPGLLMHLASLANMLDLARLSWNGEPVAVNRTPALRIADLAVALPPESFLQPSKAGERLLQDLVMESAKGAREIADLFCGCGTFALPLASRASILAIDFSAAQTVALAEAARQHRVRLTVEQRDLFRRPLAAADLQRFDAVVLDPPRAGAAAQCRELANRSVARVLYVSCNPASFARDARILCDAGYRLTRVVPVDQFLWSPHVELFAQFTR